MVTTLYLIRHGETEGAEPKRYKGSLDVPLSERGRAQASAVAEFLKRLAPAGLAAIYSSPLSRALDTARPIARSFGLAPVVIPAIRERHFGQWEGMSFDEIISAHPSAFSDWASDPLRYSPLGGESTLDVHERVVEAIEDLIGRHSGEAVAVVAHGGVNRVAICHYLGVPLTNIFRVEQGFACVNVMEFEDDFPLLRLLNASPDGKGF